MSDETKQEEVKLSDNLKKIVESVEKLTVLEVAQLVKALEDKFGVSAAPVAVAGSAPATTAAETVEEKDEFNVVITEAGANKLAVIKAIREVKTDLGLVEAKTMTEKVPATLLENAKKEAANEAKAKLEAAGAKVELQ